MKKKSAIFKSKQLEDHFDEKGFASMPNFLDQKDCAIILDLFKRYYKNAPERGMWFSSVHEVYSEAEELSEQIRAIIGAKVEESFQNHKVLLFTLANKPPKSGGFMHLHRDFSIADESVYQYRNVWIPLVDLSENNGTIFLAPGSQNKVDHYRWSVADNHEDNKYDDFKEDVMVYKAPKGSALIYAERTLHGSFSNETNFDRPVIHFGLIHKEMPILKPEKKTDGKIELKETDLKGLLNKE